MAKSNLIKLAKGGKPTTVAKKPVVEKKVLTPEEEKKRERDLKAKQKVKELLNNVDMTLPKTGDEIFELDEKKGEGVEWLTEEVTKLTAENEQLKEDYRKIFDENKGLKSGKPQQVVTSPSAPIDESIVKAKLVELFNELQANYMKNPGMSPVYPGVPNFTIYPVAFMERMIMFFPFLGKEKKYRT